MRLWQLRGKNYQNGNIGGRILIVDVGSSDEAQIPWIFLAVRAGQMRFVLAVRDAVGRAAEDLDRVFQTALDVDFGHVREQEDALVEPRLEKRVPQLLQHGQTDAQWERRVAQQQLVP